MTTIFASLVASVGLIGAAWFAAHQASRELVVKRQLESTASFLQLIAMLENRTSDGIKVGTNQQIATIWLIAEFGLNNDFLKRSAEETLTAYLRTPGYDDLAPYLRQALSLVNPKWQQRESN